MVENGGRAGLNGQIIDLIPALRNFARRFHPNAHDAEDLVQETLLKSLANLDKFEPGINLKSWMFTVMRNTFCTRFKNAKREAVVPAETITDLATIEAPQEWRIAASELGTALSHLSSDQRTALLSVVLDGASYEDVAKGSGCALGTVKSRINRARERIATELKWDGF